MKPGQDARVDYEYLRHGVVNVFVATEPLVGQRMVKITESKTMKDWAQFIKEVADRYKQAHKIILVMDNLNTDGPASLYETFEPKEAKALWDTFEFVYTPKHGSWRKPPV